MSVKNILLHDFTDERFEKAFKLYFSELGISVTKWDKLFDEMNSDSNGKNYAYVRLKNDGVVGFIQFTTVTMKSWFLNLNLVLSVSFGLQMNTEVKIMVPIL